MQQKSHTSEILIGAHTSAAGGVHRALLEGHSIGANTIQFFTANQRQWKSKPVAEEEVKRWEKAREETGIKEVMSHDSYLINLGSPSEEILEKSREAFRQELERCHQLNVTYLNFHPGAATTESKEACLDKIVESLLQYQSLAAKGSTRLLLECTAGQGSVVGCKFEELAYILDRTKDHLPMGVCIDTCHAFVAGYDMRTAESIDAVLKEFDRIVGLQHLFAFHFNDSSKGLGSRVDRHKPLGEGMIGMDCFKVLMQDPRTRYLPKYLETPDGPPLWTKEIALLRTF